METPAKRYRGFISHSQKDRLLARRLQRKLESYSIPKGALPDASRRLGRFFIDRDELAATNDLGLALKGALDESENLIVIASPAAVLSNWVDQEIIYFRNQPNRRVLTVIASGVPNAKNPPEECFPRALRPDLRMEDKGSKLLNQPLAANLTTEGFSRGFIRLVAGIIDLPFDSLWGRERRRNMHRLLIKFVGVFTACLVSFVVLGMLQNQWDSRALTTRSMEISREGWQNAWRPSFFGPSLRSAIAAVALENFSGSSAKECDLAKSVSNGTCALLLSGLSLRSSLIFGTPPTRDQGNIRLDILDGDTFGRRMITSDRFVSYIALSGDGRRVALTTNKNELLVLDTHTKKLFLNKFLQSTSTSVSLNYDGSICLVSFAPRNVLKIDVASSNVLKETKLASDSNGEFDRVNDIVSDGNHWLVFANGNEISALDSELNTLWHRTTSKSEVYNIAPFAKLARKYAVLSDRPDSSHFIEIQDLSDGQKKELSNEAIGKGVGQVKALSISSDAHLIALGGNGAGGGSLAGGQIISSDDGRELARLVGHNGEIYAIRFLPKAAGVATGATDFSIRLWDQMLGIEHLRLIGHVAPINNLAITPDGQTLISASWDGTVRMWYLPLYWATEPSRLRGDLCATNSEAEHIQAVISTLERQSISAFIGRPWNVCEWRGLDSLNGWRQLMSVIVVRWLGLTRYDYKVL